MTKVDYRTPEKAHRGYPSGSQEYFAKLIRAKVEPEKHSMPICYRHIEDLAQSISRRELAAPDRVSLNMFCCFLRQRDGA